MRQISKLLGCLLLIGGVGLVLPATTDASSSHAFGFGYNTGSAGFTIGYRSDHGHGVKHHGYRHQRRHGHGHGHGHDRHHYRHYRPSGHGHCGTSPRVYYHHRAPTYRYYAYRGSYYSY